MWPHTFGSIYTARSATVIRKNAIVLPLYQLILLFVFFVGFAATLQVPGLTGPDIDLALFKLSVKTFDPWFVGVIGATGVLTALVPGSMILITAATLIANNLYRAVDPSADDRQVSRLAKLLVPLVALVAVFFTLKGGETIVALLLMGYSLVTQLFPSLVLSLGRRGGHHRRRRHGCRRQPDRRELPHAAVAAGAGPGPQHRHRRAGGEFCRADRGQPGDAARRGAGARGRGIGSGRLFLVGDRKQRRWRSLQFNLNKRRISHG